MATGATACRARENRAPNDAGTGILTAEYANSSNEGLVQRTIAGDVAAFEAFITRHMAGLYAVALGYLGDEQAASSAICVTAVSALRDVRSRDARTEPLTWLRRHVFREIYRRLKYGTGSLPE